MSDLVNLKFCRERSVIYACRYADLLIKAKSLYEESWSESAALARKIIEEEMATVASKMACYRERYKKASAEAIKERESL